MKIEPGTLCFVRSSCEDPALRGRIVVVGWRALPGEAFAVEGGFRGRIRVKADDSGSWAVRAAVQGETLPITLVRFDGVFVEAPMRWVPVPATDLQPISGPSIDTSETGDKSLEAALAAGDLTWL